jgi:pimeloyl-ACP methyl ester carboxylesterase
MWLRRFEGQLKPRALWNTSRIILGGPESSIFDLPNIVRGSSFLSTPSETSVALFNALTAPSKKLVWFEESGHEPFVDEPTKFNAAMLQLVRSVVTARAA